jgi:hypothetical protein
MVSLLFCCLLRFMGEGRADKGGSSVAYYFAVEAWGGFEQGGAADVYFGAEEHVGEDYEVCFPGIWGGGCTREYGAYEG